MTKDSDTDLLTVLTFNCWMKKLKSDAFQLKNKTKNVPMISTSTTLAFLRNMNIVSPSKLRAVRQLSASYNSILCLQLHSLVMESGCSHQSERWAAFKKNVKKNGEEEVGNSGEQLERCSTHAADCMVGAFNGESWSADSWHFFKRKCEIWLGWEWWAALQTPNGWNALKAKKKKPAQ